MPDIELPRKYKRVLTTKARIIVLIGGRGSAKSQSVARDLIKRAQTEQADVLCGREFQTSIEESVHKLISSLIEKLHVFGARVMEKKIDFIEAGKIAGGFRYKGFARNSEAVKSAEDFKYSWIEEAQNLSKQSIKDLLPTIRAGGSKLFFTANPQASNDPFSQRFITPFIREIRRNGYYEDDMHLIIMMNWRDNPWFHESDLPQQREWDKEHMTTAEYEHVWEGAFNDTVENAIIKADWFDAAIDAHKVLGFKPRGARVVSHDPSDTGPDAKGLVYRHGSVILDVKENDKGDVNEGCDWACEFGNKVNADWFIWDCDGLGVTLRRQVDEAFKDTGTKTYMFKGSEAVDDPWELYQPDPKLDQRKAKTNKETFRNKRAQRCWTFRDRLYNTYRAVEKSEYIDRDQLISISSKIKCLEQFRSETCRIPRKYNPNGFIQIMNKEEMKRLKPPIESPNLFDSAMMGIVTPKPEPVEDPEDLKIPNLVRF